MRAFQARRGSCPGEADEELHQPASLPCLNACEARGEVLYVFGILVSRHWLFCKPPAREPPSHQVSLLMLLSTPPGRERTLPLVPFVKISTMCNNGSRWSQDNRNNWRCTSSLHHSPRCSTLRFSFFVGTRSKVRTHLDKYTIAPLISLHLRPRRSGPPWTNRSSSRAAHPSVRARPGAWCHLLPYPFL